MLAIILTIGFIVLLFVCLKKNLPLVPTMILCTFLILIVQILMKHPLSPETSSGNAVIDMFEWYMEKARANFVSVGLTSIFVLAYTNVMAKLRASDKLAYYLLKLTGPIKNKYILVGIIMFIGVLLKCPIPVGPAMLALMIQLFLPVLKKRGVSDLTCAPTVQMGSFVSYGPAEPAFVMCAGLIGLSEGEYDLFHWFVSMQLPMSLLIGAIAAVVLVFSSKILDKRDEAKGVIVKQDVISSEDYRDEELEKLPPLFAIMPIIPVVALILFGMSDMTYTIPAAMLITVVICMAVYLIARREAKGLITIVEEFCKGLGQHFMGVGLIITTAVTFSNGLSSLDGMTVLGKAMESVHAPDYILILILCLIACLAVVFLGSLFGSFGVFLPIAGIIAASRGIDPLWMGFIVMQACSCGAMMCPYNAVPAMINGTLGVDSTKAMIRNAFPSVISLIATVFIGNLIYV